MFATLIVEREPLKLETLPAAVQGWLMVVGAVAGLGLIFGVALRLARGREARGGQSLSLATWVVGVALGGALLTALPLLLRVAWNAMGWYDESAPSVGRGAWYVPFQQRLEYYKAVPLAPLMEYAAGCAVMAVLLPMLVNLARLRWRRVWALARLSFKEAVRRRVLWGFSLLLLVFLFGGWFLPHKPEDEVRNYVKAVYWAMTPLLLVTAGLLASFSLPADIKSQTLHTIVTKPVERFETSSDGSWGTRS
jgi:hypothetical protein